MELTEFDRATELQDAGAGRYVGAVHDGWDIGGNANGGYVLALAAQAMRRAAGRPDPITVTAHYLNPAPAGPAEVVTEVVKQGRRFATVTGSLRQGPRELVRVLGTFGDLAGSDDAVLADGGPPDLPPFEECPRRSNPAFPIALMHRLDVRLHPDDSAFGDDGPSGRALVRGWFGFADGRANDTLGLLLCADAFPPTVFNLGGVAGWVPTVELTVHVRAVPAPGPLRCRFGTRFIQGGFLEEDGEVWDTAGRLVALSRQLALLPRSAPAG